MLSDLTTLDLHSCLMTLAAVLLFCLGRPPALPLLFLSIPPGPVLPTDRSLRGSDGCSCLALAEQHLAVRAGGLPECLLWRVPAPLWKFRVWLACTHRGRQPGDPLWPVF